MQLEWPQIKMSERRRISLNEMVAAQLIYFKQYAQQFQRDKMIACGGQNQWKSRQEENTDMKPSLQYILALGSFAIMIMIIDNRLVNWH